MADLRDRGYLIFEGFLEADELAAAQDALWLHYPRQPGGRPLALNSARTCRKLLALILGDAVTAELITRNAAVIPRRRGMGASEVRAAAAEAALEPWTSPLQALLIAEMTGVSRYHM